MQDAPRISSSQNDQLDPARANALLVALSMAPEIGIGDALPDFFHQLYFWDARPPQSLGADGHPRVGGLVPDMGLPRRMWAGGRLAFQSPLRAGIDAEKRSICEAATRKQGRSGALALVTLRHDILQNDQLCLREYQDLVYREQADPDAPVPVAPRARTDETSCREVSFSSTLLFRYSALTFNGHRIHYDETYARTVEGYDGLVVHGPLLAQLLMLMAAEELGTLKQFSFRATSPLMHWEQAQLCRVGNVLWVRAEDGRQCMQAEATV